MGFSFKSVVRLALPLLCAGVFVFFPYSSFSMEDGEPARLFQPRLVSSQKDFFASLEDKEHPLEDRLKLASAFLQGEEGTLQQRKHICDVFFPLTKREAGLIEKGLYLMAADTIVCHGTPEQRRLVCYHLFFIFNDESIPLKERVGVAQILTKGGTLFQRKAACQFLVDCVKDDRTTFEECLVAAKTLQFQGTDAQRNQIFCALKERLMHKKEDFSLEVKMTVGSILIYSGITSEQCAYGAEILTEGLEKDSSLLSKDRGDMGFEGAVLVLGKSSQKDRIRKVLLSVFRDEKRSSQERLRSAEVVTQGEPSEEQNCIPDEMGYMIDRGIPLPFSLEERINISRIFINSYYLTGERKEKELTFLLTTAKNKSHAVDIRMKAADVVSSFHGSDKEEAEKIIISLVGEFSILPPDSFYSMPNIMFNGIEDKRTALGKSLLSILENNELSISPVVRVRFLTLFSLPALPEHKTRVNFLLQSFLEEGERSLFLEKSCMAAARALAQAGDSSQKSYGMQILRSVFENEDVSLELRLEALTAFMGNGGSVEKKMGGRLLLSFLEDHDISLGQRISAARTLGEWGTEEQEKKMKAILSGLLQSSEMIPGFSGAIREILEGHAE